MRTAPGILILMLGAACCAPGPAAQAATAAATEPVPTLAKIPGGTFATVIPPADKVKEATVSPFEMDRRPVTNAEFARFVRERPEWQRGRVSPLFADAGYLRHWKTATDPGSELAAQPVTQVSWFAAKSYCEARGARLPTWYEWEFVAAAGEKVADARSDPLWRQAILEWYARPADAKLPDAGSTTPNYYGVRDMHGVVWEWILDISSLMVSGDNREQGDPDVVKFCGSGALSLEQKDNYAMMMRIAMLSSMRGNYSSSTMGFRCVVGQEPGP